MTTQTVSIQDLAALAVQIQEYLDGYYAAHYKHAAPVISVAPGRRYAKIVKTHGIGGEVYGFVDMTSGALLKAKSWKAPRPGPRGHISDAMKCCGPWGIG